MKSWKTAVCDDEIMLLPQLAAVIKNAFRKRELTASLEVFSSAEDLLKQILGGNYCDIYFLDIDLPGQNGILLAQKIRAVCPDALILFVSAKEELVYHTFQVQPLAFVRKSCFREDMEQAMDLLADPLRKEPEPVLMFEDDLGHVIPLHINQVLYVEAQEKYQYIVGTDGRKLVRCTITKLERELTSYHFFRIHRGYLVNFRYVYRIDTGHVILDNGEKLPLSRHRRKEALQLFFGYIR